MHMLVISVAVFAAVLSTVRTMPIGPSNGVLITPNNVQYFASYLHSGTDIQSRAIRFPPGSFDHEKLLEIPILAPGEITPFLSVRVTVGMDRTRPSTGSVDHDPRVGLSDGTNAQAFWFPDTGNYGHSTDGHFACGVFSNEGTNENYKVLSGPTPAEFTLLFTPYHKYGACSTGQNAGYINVVTFSSELDTSKGVNLLVQRHNAGEEYRFHYFMVEILK